MTSAERRARIFSRLTAADTPISAASLAREFSVTRQIVVGDVALLRAEGHNIAATPRGYIIPSTTQGTIHQIACNHTADQTRDELNIMVDCGCTVLDVIVEHPVYGQLTAPLQISSRYDVEQFISRMQQAEALPLCILTEGIHLHTLSCPSEDAYLHMKTLLQEGHFLLE